jgi:uncharacterized protein YbjQ (UPF0145 family)
VTETKHLLSGQLTAPELYALLCSGYEPIGVVMGVAAISMGTRGFGRSIQAIFRKGEMSALSQTSQEARKLALQRTEDEAKALGADLFLVHHWEIRDAAEIVEVTCTATACRKTDKGLLQMPIATATS